MRQEPPARNIIVAFLIVAIAIIGGAVLLLTSRPQPVQITIIPPEPTITPSPPGTISVYVTGEVAQEGIVSIPHGSRVEEALAAAGGTTENADLTRVNLAAILHDGDQVHVFALPAADTPQGEPSLATPPGGAVVYINTATLEELQTLPGIGPGTAQAIIDYREANGPFRNMDDLDQVPGIGPATLANLEGLISFD